MPSDHAPPFWTNPGRALWPENSTSSMPLSVIWSNPIASAATTRPTAGMITNGSFGTNFAVRSPRRRTGMVNTAAARPITMVQPICASVGWENGARCNGTSEYALVLSPVQSPMPTNTSDPIPAAIRPGSTISGSVAPPRPAASITRIAATSGEPKIAEIAAKAPAAPMTTSSWGGASFLASCTVNSATPPPNAMSGASGPSTSPRPIVANAASTTPGSMLGSVVPIWRPFAGMWPPPPGGARWQRQRGNRRGRAPEAATTTEHC